MLGTFVAVAAGFEAYGIDSAVHFRFAEDVDDLLVQRVSLDRSTTSKPWDLA